MSIAPLVRPLVSLFATLTALLLAADARAQSVVTQLAIGDARAVAVNTATNRIYALTDDSRGPIAIIDGSSNAARFLTPAGHAVGPRALAVNANTDRIYAGFSNEVIVLDGAREAMTFIPTGPIAAVAVNVTSNKAS